MTTSNDPAIYIDTHEMRKRSRGIGLETLGVVPALLAYGNGQPFAWDEVAISAFLTREVPVDPMTPDRLRAMRPGLLRFFAELPDGRWAPSNEVFSAVSANSGTES
ncbi:MAG: hypothetical protein NVS1B6_18130 [Steroidobacteraceae bacterium]